MTAALPEVVERFLTPVPADRTTAHVAVDTAGRISDWGGALSHFGLNRSNLTWIVDMFTPWFDPMEDSGSQTPVPFVEFATNAIADIHFVPDTDVTWVVLVDRTRDALVAQQEQQSRLLPYLDLRTAERSRNPGTAGGASVESVLRELHVLMFERPRNGTFAVMGELPTWVEHVDGVLLEGSEFEPADHPVLQYFLPEAEQAWADPNGKPVYSFVWSEELQAGETVHLQAIAIAVEASEVLVVRLLSQFEIENSANVQRSNDHALLAADAERRLYNESQRLLVTLESIAEAVLTTDQHGCIEFINPMAEQLTGWTLDQARGRPSHEVVRLVDDSTDAPLDDLVRRALAGDKALSDSDTVLIGRAGSRYGIRVSTAPIFDADGDLLGVVVVLRDVTAMRAMVREAEYQAKHDPLTGLPNRREFEQSANWLMANASETSEVHAVCYVDLDGFKSVNDAAGHQAGDAVLQEVARRLLGSVRTGDVVARIGGDEFGVLLERCDAKGAERIARKLATVIGERVIASESQEYAVGASVGFALITSDSGSFAEVMAEADAACYAAKRSRRGARARSRRKSGRSR